MVKTKDKCVLSAETIAIIDAIHTDEVDSAESSDTDQDCTHDVMEPATEYIRIIGRAGIGKSTYIRENYPKYQYLRMAFTGIAASQIDAKTISSIFYLGHRNQNSVGFALKHMFWKTKSKIKNIKGIVVDEFYTLNSAVMDKVNEILKCLLGIDEPFGGLDVILAGDPRQTAAIGEPFVESKLYKSLNFREINLPIHENMRLTYDYMDFCDQFRNPRMAKTKIRRMLKNSQFSKDPIDGVGVRTVFHGNRSVDAFNLITLSEYDGPVIYTQYHVQNEVYDADEELPEGFTQTRKTKKKIYGFVIGKPKLEYKEGMPIYIGSNHPDGLYYNGTIGNLVKNKDDVLSVLVDEETIEIAKHVVDFRPAFAMTIHKAQAKTFAGINIYVSWSKLNRDKDDSLRLIYTAMTRVRDFKNCYIKIEK